MLDWKQEQEKLYQWFVSQNVRCFLRVDQSDDALWVTDLPRRHPKTGVWEETLGKRGISCTPDVSGLWHLDWTLEEWARRLDGLPDQIPPLCENENKHAAYALCRFGLLHPAARSDESMRFLRKLLKGTTDMHTLHEMAAEACRNGNPIAYDAARVLAVRLKKENER